MKARVGLDITIDISQRQRFFDQLQEFSDKNSFAFRIETSPADPEDFYVEMYRKDIEISGANPFAPGEYKLGFFDVDRLHPAPLSILYDLGHDLRNFINEVPGATFFLEVKQI